MPKRHIQRALSTPKRRKISWSQTWQANDKGLIVCWESGRELATTDKALAKKVKSGELPMLVWRGGVEEKLKSGKKEGSLHYLAQWQGLRGKALDIDLSKEYQITCSRTQVTVTFNKQSTTHKELPPAEKKTKKKAQKKKSVTRKPKKAGNGRKRNQIKQRNLI